MYSGYYPRDGNIVLKIFLPNAEPERALREVKGAQATCSSHVPAIYDMGNAKSNIGHVIWVREAQIPGETLRVIVSRGALDPLAVLRISLDMLDALAAAERARIVHRDVKPDNIIVDPNGAGWLLDFGIARHLDMQSITATAARFGVGTPGYAPPEQFRNDKPQIDSRSDLFALGVTLYECSEGINPFRNGAQDIAEIIRRVEQRPLPPIARPIDADNQFRELVLAMTRIKRDHRPATAATALDWLQQICAREGIK